MTDLLKKNTKKVSDNTNLLKPSNAPKPDKIYQNEELKKIKVKKKSTTIRCDLETSNLLNAISAVLDLDSVNEVLNTMANNYLTTLTTDEQREIRTIKKIYDKNLG